MIEVSVDDGYGLKFSVTTLVNPSDPTEFIVNMEIERLHTQLVDSYFLEEIKKCIDVALSVPPDVCNECAESEVVE